MILSYCNFHICHMIMYDDPEVDGNWHVQSYSHLSDVVYSHILSTVLPDYYRILCKYICKVRMIVLCHQATNMTYLYTYPKTYYRRGSHMFPLNNRRSWAGHSGCSHLPRSRSMLCAKWRKGAALVAGSWFVMIRILRKGGHPTPNMDWSGFSCLSDIGLEHIREKRIRHA